LPDANRQPASLATWDASRQRPNLGAAENEKAEGSKQERAWARPILRFCMPYFPLPTYYFRSYWSPLPFSRTYSDPPSD